MYELVRVRADHEATILEFEVVNRTYFTASISDRGNEYFENFTQEHRTLLEEQATGNFAFHVLVDDRDAVVGRFNLYDIADGAAVVGYRVAEDVAGVGVATVALRELCRMSRDDYGLHTLRAATNHENLASQRVLQKAGFVADGPAEVGGRPGLWYALDLTTL
jgi:[ribosomal protein S5]-alanine N-acetyltransferase